MDVDALTIMKQSVDDNNTILLDVQEQVNDLTTRLAYQKQADIQYDATLTRLQEQYEDI